MEENNERKTRVKSKVQPKSKEELAKRDKIVFITIAAVVIVAIIVIVVILMNSKGNKTNQMQGENNVNMENVEVKPDGTKQNNSNKLKETKTFEETEVRDIKLISQGGLTNFTAIVQNMTETDKEGKPVQIVFTNSNGEEIAVLEAYIGDLKAKGSTMVDASATADLSNAFDFTVRNRE